MGEPVTRWLGASVGASDTTMGAAVGGTVGAAEGTASGATETGKHKLPRQGHQSEETHAGSELSVHVPAVTLHPRHVLQS